jgi:hypothetical protein
MYGSNRRQATVAYSARMATCRVRQCKPVTSAPNPLLAQSRHDLVRGTCPLSEAKQTLWPPLLMHLMMVLNWAFGFVSAQFVVPGDLLRREYCDSREVIFQMRRPQRGLRSADLLRGDF